ncbi:MAG: hypothetical protein Ta2E_00080 [Mycoplasmoidaceae bacterium]|nr:MAG: hypothetical protein Ta2E_00080 [Mycoplasmoidaceae bacterium]
MLIDDFGSDVEVADGSHVGIDFAVGIGCIGSFYFSSMAYIA